MTHKGTITKKAWVILKRKREMWGTANTRANANDIVLLAHGLSGEFSIHPCTIIYQLPPNNK